MEHHQFLITSKRKDGFVIVNPPFTAVQLNAIDNAEWAFEIGEQHIETLRLYRVEDSGELTLVTTQTRKAPDDFDVLKDILADGEWS